MVKWATASPVRTASVLPRQFGYSSLSWHLDFADHNIEFTQLIARQEDQAKGGGGGHHEGEEGDAFVRRPLRI